MTKYIETTGKNEDEAIATALAALGLERDDVSVEIVDRAKSGFLGLGGTPAKVRVSYEVPDEIGAAPVSEDKPRREERPRREDRPRRNDRPRREEPPRREEQERENAAPVAPRRLVATTPVREDDEAGTQIRSFLEGLLQHMDVTAQIEMGLTDEGNYRVTLAGENMGAVIGRRGETLDAIQQITSYSINKGRSGRVRIHIDAENYRAKREEQLEKLALRSAERVRRTRRSFTLDSMNAYERHVVHTALQDLVGITTQSTGAEPNRRVVILPEN